MLDNLIMLHASDAPLSAAGAGRQPDALCNPLTHSTQQYIRLAVQSALNGSSDGVDAAGGSPAACA